MVKHFSRKIKLETNDSIDVLFPEQDPGKAAVRGGAINLASKGFMVVFQMGSTMILARLLAPEMFGLISMASIFTGFAQMLKNAGLSMATVQRKELTHGQISNLFWCNVALGLALSILFAVTSPLMAWIYDDPRIMNVALVISVSYVISAASIQQTALFRRQMRYGLLAAINMAGFIVGILICIGLAYKGYGYWALASQFVTSPVIITILTWIFSNWKPSWPVRRVGTFSLLGFGANLTFSQAMSLIAQRADRFLLGLVWGPQVVGFYAKAQGLMMLIKMHVISSISSGTIPSLCRLQEDEHKFRRMYKQGIEIICSIVAPFAFFSVIEARNIVLFVLGDQWEACVPLLRFFSLLIFFDCITNSISWVLTPFGRGKKIMLCSYFRTSVTLCGVFLGLPFGAQGVAIGISVAAATSYFPRFLYAARGSYIRFSDLLKAMWRAVVAAFLSGAILFYLKMYLIPSTDNPLLDLAWSGPLYLLLYVAFLWYLPGKSNVLKTIHGKVLAAVKKRFRHFPGTKKGIEHA